MKIYEAYKAPKAFKYGLKISSPFEDEFRNVAEAGGEVIKVASGEHRIFENDLSKHRLVIVIVGQGGFFEYREAVKGLVSTKSDLYVFLKGEGAKAEISARYDIDGASKLDVLHRVYHEANDTTSNINTRGVLRDDVYVIYRSDIDMKENLSGLSGGENAKFLLLSKGAKVDAIPALDIASREVSTSHTLSISRLSDKMLFYPKLRGFSSESAADVIISGFLNIHV